MLTSKITFITITILNLFIYGKYARAESLIESLQKYCIPASGYCANKANYNATLNVCECSQCNMYYDKTTRSCKKCATGSYTENRHSTECIKPSCPSGTIAKVTVGVNTCPAGYKRKLVMSCK